MREGFTLEERLKHFFHGIKVKLFKKDIPIGKGINDYTWISNLSDELHEVQEEAKKTYQELKDEVFSLEGYKGYFRIASLGPVTATDWLLERIPITYERIEPPANYSGKPKHLKGQWRVVPHPFGIHP